MNDSFANRGHIKLAGTSPLDISASPIGGFTPVNGDFTLAAITFPSAVNGMAYRGDPAFLTTLTFKEGVFYPIPATALTPAAGKAIGWLQD